LKSKKLKPDSKKTPEYTAFENLLDQIIQVPHSEIKAKLDAEKAEKAKKRSAKKPSASGPASRDKG
jgi:hypothetical protein